MAFIKVFFRWLDTPLASLSLVNPAMEWSRFRITDFSAGGVWNKRSNLSVNGLPEPQ